MDQKGDYMKMNFEYFQIQKWMFMETVRAEKADETFRVPFPSYGP